MKFKVWVPGEIEIPDEQVEAVIAEYARKNNVEVVPALIIYDADLLVTAIRLGVSVAPQNGYYVRDAHSYWRVSELRSKVRLGLARVRRAAREKRTVSKPLASAPMPPTDDVSLENYFAFVATMLPDAFPAGMDAIACGRWWSVLGERLAKEIPLRLFAVAVNLAFAAYAAGLKRGRSPQEE